MAVDVCGKGLQISAVRNINAAAYGVAYRLLFMNHLARYQIASPVPDSAEDLLLLQVLMAGERQRPLVQEPAAPLAGGWWTQKNGCQRQKQLAREQRCTNPSAFTDISASIEGDSQICMHACNIYVHTYMCFARFAVHCAHK
jgi:hypothetical protein